MTELNKRDDAPEPCPFCKSEKVTTSFDHEQGLKWGYASCDGCAARGPDVRTNWDREPDAPWHSEAIAAWNTRALPAIDSAAIPALQARIDELKAACWRMMEDRDRAIGWRDHNWTRADTAEAKLAKAKAYLQKISRHANRSCAAIAAHALAEMDGK